MSYSEMTITLDDVGTIIRISVTGKSVSGDSLLVERAKSLVSFALGVSPEDAYNELSGARDISVRLEWLRDVFGDVYDANLKQQIRNVARAFLSYILGYTLFIDKSGTRAPLIYLRLLMDLDEVRTYAWGAAALTYLYI
ncbi:hypothetical protein AAC387_Pa03g1687 [Persea americana]